MTRAIIASRATSVRVINSNKAVVPRRNFQSKSRQVQHRPKAVDVSTSFIETTYYVGKYITLFTMFYTSLNWMMYRNARKDYETDDKENKQ